MSTSTIKGSKNGASLNSNKKHTIANLFSTREQKSSRADDSSASSSLPNKKLKLSDGSEVYVAVDTPATTFKPVLLQDMYNFPGKAAASSFSSSATNKTTIGTVSNGDVVDLTGNDDVTASSSGQTQQKKKMKECSNVINGSSGNTRNGFLRPQNPNFTPHTGAKKIQVKNLRINSKSDPRQYYERVWEQLRSALGAIFKEEKVASLEELYRGVNHVCLQGFSSDLAEKLEGNLESYVSVTLRRDVVAKAEAVTNAKRPEAEIDVLRLVLEAWDTWKEQMVSHTYILYKGLQARNHNKASQGARHHSNVRSAQFNGFFFTLTAHTLSMRQTQVSRSLASTSSANISSKNLSSNQKSSMELAN